MLQAYFTFCISITAKRDPATAVRVTMMDYELECANKDHSERMGETIERMRPLIKSHGDVTKLCQEMKQTCRDIVGYVRPEKWFLQMLQDQRANRK
jgi:hypothetical protein